MKNLDKRIITHKWGNNPTHDEYTNTNGFIISNFYGRGLTLYNELIKTAKEDFPFLKDEDIELSRVTESSYNKGCILIYFPLPENYKKEGYFEDSKIDFYY
jgi:hypothetical protein